MNAGEARELLPWFVTGSLSEDEMRLVQTFIDNGEIKVEELDELAMLQEVVHEQTADEPVYDAAILDRALVQIDAMEARGEGDRKSSATTRETSPRRFAAWLADVTTAFQWQRTPVFARAAIVGQLALVAALTVALVFGSAGEKDPEFTTVSGAQIGDLHVRFAPNVTESQVRALLLDVGGNIVEGPTALGLYTIDLADSVVEADAIAAIKGSGFTVYLQPVAEQ